MRTISLFSGAGGFDLGLIQTGHEIVLANDILKDACETYKKNISQNIICSQIQDIDFRKAPKADLVIGGFPCQGFSIANMDRKSSDPRNSLYLEFLRTLEFVKPKYFLAENVRGILSLEKGEVFKKIIKDFNSQGYVTQHLVLNAAKFGVPQNRFRVFIFGVNIKVFDYFF